MLAWLRGCLIVVAAWELVWSLAFYFRPDVALGALGRTVLDPVIARQYPLYLASVALAYALAARDPVRFRGVVWICVVQRAAEAATAATDTRAFVSVGALELGTLAVLVALLRSTPNDARGPGRVDTRDRGLVRLLRFFGGLQLFWFAASTVFVQLGARLLGWKLQDPYTTQQQGIALLVIGLVSIVASSDIARYRALVWVPIASQLIGMANAVNEVRLGTIGWSAAAIQWTIQAAIVGAFAFFMRRRVGSV